MVHVQEALDQSQVRHKKCLSLHELRSQASSLKVSLVDTVLRLCAPSPPVCGHYLYREEISSRHVWWFERK